MKKFAMSIIIFVIVLMNVFCQKKDNKNYEEDNINYKEIYEILFNEKKYDELYVHLRIWETKEPNNPEMNIAYFNYYIFRDVFSGISIDDDNKGDGLSISISDPETGEIVGYLSESTKYRENDIIIAVKYLDKGLSIAPNRLDMHFGKIHILNQIGFYNDAGDALYTALEISQEIDNNWLWSNNEKIENGELYLLNSINDYYGLWLNVKTEGSLNQIKKCIEKQIILYPEQIYSYNILAVYYTMKDQYQEALKYFLQAETIDPNDCIVLLNIGRTYMNIKNYQEAKEYFLKVINTGNDQYKEIAEYYLNQIR